MKIVVIEGSGLIGTKLVKRLPEASHEVIAASPNSGVNTITGEGMFNRRCFVRPIGANHTSADFCQGDA
jgi:uncharacterized protein YbjT (DUF2867 family)